jgi:CRISPR-associated endonuclease/helicase Cas3
MGSNTRQTERQLLDRLAEEYPEGLSSSQLAEMLNITPETVRQIIGRVGDEAGISQDGNARATRYYLDPATYLRPLQLTHAQSWLLYLALRRVVRAQQTRFPIMRSLVHRLLHLLHPQLQSPFAEDDGRQSDDKVLDTLVTGWKKSQLVAIQYRPLGKPQVNQWVIAPMWFEPAIWSDANYVVAQVYLNNGVQMMTLKLDRVEAAQLKEDRFEPRPIEAILEKLDHTWGIWAGADAPQHVTLKFEPRVEQRINETIWHPSQKISKGDDGSILWEAAISEPLEMLPWVRGWGADVEVIKPDFLREEVIRHLHRQVEFYSLSSIPKALPLWAKYDRGTRSYHLLICHLLDVGAVAAVMWDYVLCASQKRWLCELLGVNEEAAKRWVVMLAAAHDVGKASPDFQSKVPELYEQLMAETDLSELQDHGIEHGTWSAHIISGWLAIRFKSERPCANRLGYAIGGHHGQWIAARDKQRVADDRHWQALQYKLLDDLQSLLQIREHFDIDTQRCNLFAMFISGLTSVCDWLGSMSNYFPFHWQTVDLPNYFAHACRQAEVALSETGWLGWQSDIAGGSFESVSAISPNPLQQTVINHFKNTPKAPRLVIVEYPPGGGKTEAALYLAGHLIGALKLAGIYVAMPTQATSNQMFERFGRYLEAQYPGQSINVHLIHGQSEQNTLYSNLRVGPAREGNESGLIAAEWFQNHKRALLSPFAVGTIDQAMLGVLQARHHFVRMYGLSHKVVVFDEIHAYDTYMNTIIEHLIEWLLAMQSTVILLSATLSQTTRDRILDKYGHAPGIPSSIPYPRLTMIYDEGVETIPLPPPNPRSIQLVQIANGLNALTAAVKAIYEHGGCIAILCNTVDEAIEVARAAREVERIDARDVYLFHARFPPLWRREIEEQVVSMFGKDGNRPARAIVVATQVIEQSLDLDFDVMFTSTAPIDLLIQRAGRVHRHDRHRYPHLQQPTLIIREPTFASGDVPDFGADSYVYETFPLLKTWLLIRDRETIVIPDEVDALVDAIYTEGPTQAASAEYQEALDQAQRELEQADEHSGYKAQNILIGEAQDNHLIGGSDRGITDNPESPEFSIATRDIRAGIAIVCVAEAEREALLNDTDALLQRRLVIQGKGVVARLAELQPEARWQRIPRLREAKLIVFNGDGEFRVPNSTYVLRLSEEYGLEILNEEGA